MSSVLFFILPNKRFVDLGLYQYGWGQCEPPHSYSPCARDRYLFHYCIFGTGTLISTDSKGEFHTYQIKSGEGPLIYPEQISTYSTDKNHPQEYTWVEFDNLRVKEALELAGLAVDVPVYHSNAYDSSLKLKSEILYTTRHSNQSPFHLIGHLYPLLDYLARSSVSRRLLKTGCLQDFYIHEATSFTEQNFQDGISVEDTTAFYNLDRGYFNKIFRDATGKSPQELLVSYRMTEVAELLKLTELSINDISNVVGYPNQFHFSHVFKKTYGIPPHQWRQESKATPAA